MQTCKLEGQLETFVEKLSTPSQMGGQFGEFKPLAGYSQSSQSDKLIPRFEEQLTSTGSEGVLSLAVGAAFAGTIGGLLNNFLPIGALAVPVAGWLIMRFAKGGGFMHGFGKGILIAGIANLLSGLVGGVAGGAGGLLGGLFGGQRSNAMTTSTGQTVVT